MSLKITPADGGLDDHAGRELLLAFALSFLCAGRRQLDHRVHADLALAESARKTSLGVAKIIAARPELARGRFDGEVVRAHARCPASG